MHMGQLWTIQSGNFHATIAKIVELQRVPPTSYLPCVNIAEDLGLEKNKQLWNNEVGG